ncbi:alginate lyase family protein [Flavobacterium faecale]|uniref:alginate lyase family protein n=1 Tax=Flavobacterium faecale TaxID=1355330 RepID=UPI003AAE1DD8
MKKAIITIALFVVSVTEAQVCVWNMKSLKKAKASNTEEVQSIVRDADKKLTQTITTVMDKEMTPSSGDKHDYMSMGRYWWPDPKKADGLPYIRKDGVSNPEIEKLDRYPLGSFAKSVETLSLAYYLTSDEKYAQKAVDNLRIWFINEATKMNPNMNYGQTIPGVRNGLGRGEGVLDTYSFLEMLDGVELLKKSKSFTDADQQAIKEWFLSYVNWLQNSPVAAEEQAAKNNHGTAFDVQLARYAMFVGNCDLAKKIVNEFPQKRLFAQIQPDGSQPLELARTTAFGYSVFNLTHFLDMVNIGQILKIDLLKAKSKDGRSILKAIDFLVPYINKPVAEFPYKQISDWEGVQLKLCWQLYRVDQMLSKPLYEKYYKDVLASSKKYNEFILY